MEPADDADLTAFDDADAGFTAGDAPFAKLASFTADDDDEEEEPAKAPDAALSASVALEPPAPELLVSVALEPPPAPVVVSTEDLAAMAPTPVAAPPAPPSPATAPASPVVQQPTPPSALQPQQDPARADALCVIRSLVKNRRMIAGGAAGALLSSSQQPSGALIPSHSPYERHAILIAASVLRLR